jgi:hypothetical protein
VPGSLAKAAWLRIRPAWDQACRICAAVSAPAPGSAVTRPGAMPPGDAGDLGPGAGGFGGRGGDALAGAGQDLAGGAGEPAAPGGHCPAAQTAGHCQAAQTAGRRLAGTRRSCSRSGAGAVTTMEASAAAPAWEETPAAIL